MRLRRSPPAPVEKVDVPARPTLPLYLSTRDITNMMILSSNFGRSLDEFEKGYMKSSLEETRAKCKAALEWSDAEGPSSVIDIVYVR